MIDIDIIRRKRNGGTTGTTAGVATTIGGRTDKASEADHAQRADNATHADSAKELDGDSTVWQKLRDTIGALDDVYLSKTDDDTAQGLITFAKGLVSKAVAKMEQGVTFGTGGCKVDGSGDATLDGIRSLDYDNASEQGFSIEKTAQGRYQAFLTNLTVWGKAVFNELEIRKLSYAGGNVYLSGAGSKIVEAVAVKKVTDAESGTVTWEACSESDADCAGWKCYLLADDGTTATMNHWQEGDQARCQTTGEITSAGTYKDASDRSYWRTIPDGGVSTGNERIMADDGATELHGGQGFAWIVLGKHSTAFDGVTEGDTATAELQDTPQAGDTIVLDGNRHRGTDGNFDKQDRQNVIVLETTGDYAPRIACFANVSEYKHTVTKTAGGEKKEVSLSVFETSPKGGTRISSSRFEWTADDGSTVDMIVYRGAWKDGETYHRNDQVDHNNAVWVCVAASGVDVTEEPKDGSAVWRKTLTGGSGEKGDKGDPGVAYVLSVTSDVGNAFVNGQGKMTLTATLAKNGEDITATIPDGCWSWYRISADTDGDATWSKLHDGLGNTCAITSEDVDRMAQFGCRAYEVDAATKARKLMADSMG